MTYHVSEEPDHTWTVFKEGGTNYKHEATKMDAIDYAKEKLINAGGGQIALHGSNGQIQAFIPVP